MGKRLTLAEHLPPKQIEKRYRDANDPVERSQWQMIWRLACGKVTEQVAEVVGYSIGWIRTIALPRSSIKFLKFASKIAILKKGKEQVIG